MKESYDESLRRLLVSEGGYTNHPSDPGGPTNFGITIADYRRYMKPGATAGDVRAMSVEEAKAIYRSKYWNALRCDDLPKGVDYCVFDYGVNSGIGRSGKVLRRVLGMDDSTSAITDQVIKNCLKVGREALINSICDERLRFLKSLKTWPVFGAGWERRVSEVRRASLNMARTPMLNEITVAVGASESKGKAVVPQPEKVKNAIGAGGPGTAAAVGGGTAWDWITSHPWETAAIGVAVVAISGAIVYLIHRHYQKKNEAAAPGWVSPNLLAISA